MKKWYIKNDLEGLCKRFVSSLLHYDLFWHKCGCVKMHQNDETSIGPGRIGFLEFNYGSTSQFGVQLVSKKSNTAHKIVYETI